MAAKRLTDRVVPHAILASRPRTVPSSLLFSASGHSRLNWPCGASVAGARLQPVRTFAKRARTVKRATLVKVDAKGQTQIEASMSGVDTVPDSLKALEGIASTANLLEDVLNDPHVAGSMTEEEKEALKGLSGRHTFSMPEIMAIKKKALILKYGKNPQDSGNSGVQIAIWSERLRQLKAHASFNHQDKSNLRRMEILIHKRRKLLLYIRRKDYPVYARLMRDNNLHEKEILFYGMDNTRAEQKWNRPLGKKHWAMKTDIAPPANPLGFAIPTKVE
eukprot:gb/GEZN01013039.1/.p1 GENE.gb/GEZN01013039.1/~~gb/GEZN01013039.1/.p1  ORF type:complete len:284 (-),score=32.84 gb/GEZN01013039.1/:187-1014(-)